MNIDKLVAFRRVVQGLRQGNSESRYYDSFEQIVRLAASENPLFTRKNVMHALEVLEVNLTEKNLFALNEKIELRKEVRISTLIAEKDILSGFSDWLMAILTGNAITFQLPENNRRFLPEVVSWFVKEHPEMQPYFSFTEGRIEKPEYLLTYPLEENEQQLIKYFKAYPGVARMKKKSVAVLTGEESREDLKILVEGTMRFFSQGNHRVSKILVPEGYDFTRLLESFEDYMELKDHHSYRNNYDYYKSIYLLNQENFFDNELVLIKEDDKQFLSPLSVIYFSYYQSKKQLPEMIDQRYVSGVYDSQSGAGPAWTEMKDPAFASWEFYPPTR